MSPNEYYQFCIMGEYPLAVADPLFAPIAEKKPDELGEKRGSDDGTGTEPKDSALDVRRPVSP